MIRTALAAALCAVAGAAHAAPQCQPGEIPDPNCTPGVVASTDVADVCVVVDGLSYSKRHRKTPEGLKALIRHRYGMPDDFRGEIDHIIPLCAGGIDAVYNLFPQSGQGKWSYHVKDKMEAEVCRRICGNHTMSLTQGQALFTPDWRVGYCVVFPGDSERCGRFGNQ